MTHDEHRKRHKLLHSMLDELLADFIRHNEPDPEHGYIDRPISELMEWSHQQTIEPQEEK